MSGHPRLAALAGVTALMTAACGAAGGAAQQAPNAVPSGSGRLPAGAQISDPPNINQPSPTPANEAARLLQSSLETLTLCGGWRGILKLDEPPQYDVDKTLAYATSVANSLNQIDPTAKIQDKHSLQKKDVSLPPAVKAALKTEQLYYGAYETRLTTAQNDEQQHSATTAQLDQFLDHAFQQLVTSRTLTDADLTVAGFYNQYC